ncbi:MAG: hypothetical protein WKF84_21115 [Pyrinomonadaceae bacterium]
MLSASRRTPAKLAALICRFLLLLFIPLCANFTQAASTKIYCRPELSSRLREELSQHLREITGWSNLHFDRDGAMKYGGASVGGSSTARELIDEAAGAAKISVLEDASERVDVVFGRVVPGAWTRSASNKLPVYVVLIDFADFKYVAGDKTAKAAFNAGWAALHEIAHVVRDLPDAEGMNELGDCEKLINLMRRECGLAERAEYFFTLYPGMEQSAFTTKLVRLAFVRDVPTNRKKRRYWLIWNAALVGGIGLSEIGNLRN